MISSWTLESLRISCSSSWLVTKVLALAQISVDRWDNDSSELVGVTNEPDVDSGESLEDSGWVNGSAEVEKAASRPALDDSDDNDDSGESLDDSVWVNGSADVEKGAAQVGRLRMTQMTMRTQWIQTWMTQWESKMRWSRWVSEKSLSLIYKTMTCRRLFEHRVCTMFISE
jgi:hypothetical protein